MRVVCPPNQNVVGETIIYVDSPEIRQKYEADLAAFKESSGKELIEAKKKLVELQEEISRKESQISTHILQLNEQKSLTAKALAKPDISPATAKHIDSLKAQIQTIAKEKTELQAKYELLNSSYEQLLRKLDIEKTSNAELQKRLMTLLIQEVPNYHKPKTWLGFILVEQINWRHWAVLSSSLAGILGLGILVGKVVFHG